MNRKAILIGAAVVVLVGGGGLIWELGRKSESQSVSVPVKPAPAPVQQPAIVPGPDRPTPPLTTPTGETSVPSPNDDVREVRRGDMVIHDHRDNPTAAMDPTPVIKPPGGRLLPPDVANSLAAVFRPSVNKCTEAIPADAKGKAPRIDAHITVAIKGGKLSVTSVDQPVVGDIQGDAAATVRDCMKAAFASATMTTTEADIENYPISIAMPLQTSK